MVLPLGKDTEIATAYSRHHPGKKREPLGEQLVGKREPTQFGRLLEELGIISIPSYSPQARGRIERLWGTFQDRLVSELRLAGAQSIAQANQVMQDFLPHYNSRFALPASQPGSAYRPPVPGFIPQEVFCFKYQRTVGADPSWEGSCASNPVACKSSLEWPDPATHAPR